MNFSRRKGILFHATVQSNVHNPVRTSRNGGSAVQVLASLFRHALHIYFSDGVFLIEATRSERFPVYIPGA
jgi:hypothetical protein